MIIYKSSTNHPWQLPSGKRLHIAMENHHFQWVNQLFQWAIFNSKLLVYQRVNSHIDEVPKMSSPGRSQPGSGDASCRAVLCAAWASFTSAAWAVWKSGVCESISQWESYGILIYIYDYIWVYKSLFFPNEVMNIDDHFPLFLYPIQLLTMALILWKAFQRQRMNRNENDYQIHSTSFKYSRAALLLSNSSSWLSECKHPSILPSKRVSLGPVLALLISFGSSWHTFRTRFEQARNKKHNGPSVVPVLAHAFRASHQSAPAEHH